MAELLSSSLESDGIDGLLRDLRVSSTVFCRSTLSAPWGFGVRARGLAAFHVVVSGDCWLQIDADGEPRRLHADDLVILPRGNAHWTSATPTPRSHCAPASRFSRSRASWARASR